VVTFNGVYYDIETQTLGFLLDLYHRDLDNYIKDDSKVYCMSERIKILTDVANGLCWIHNMEDPIIHHDLKPSNILLDEDNNAKIGDFGLSILKKQNEKVRSFTGSVLWMAPEILRNEEHDEKSDIYSLGLICWQMITNEILPYKEFNRGINIFIEKISEERVRPSIQRVPICFRDLLDRLWHHDPYLRPMAGEIEDLLFDRLVDFEIPFELGRNFWKQKKEKDRFLATKSYIILEVSCYLKNIN